jgi:hypothetical protein
MSLDGATLIKDRSMCEELCRKRAYLEKLLADREINLERCVKICTAMAKP